MKRVWMGLALAVVLIAIGFGVGVLQGNTEPKQPSVKIIEEPKQEPQEEVNEDTIIPERYKEIANIIRDYELPEEGITDAPTEPYIERVVYYENGYSFDKYTKRLIGRTYMPEDGPEKPTESQCLGVIMGHIGDINYNATIESNLLNDYKLDIQPKLKKLYEIRIYAENYELIRKWTEETIGYLEESKELMETDNDKAMELYNAACKKIEDFDKVIDAHAIQQPE